MRGVELLSLIAWRAINKHSDTKVLNRSNVVVVYAFVIVDANIAKATILVEIVFCALKIAMLG